MGFIGRILPVFIGWIIWRQTGNIIFGAIVAVVIEALIGPVINELGLLFVKPLVLKAEDEVPQGYESKGVRILTGKKKGCELTPEEMIGKGLDDMKDDSKFTAMLSAAGESGLPEVKYSCEYEKKDNAVLTKTFREWRKNPDIADLFDSKENDDRFFAYDEPSGEFFTAWLFSKEIPIPAASETVAETQDTPEEGGDKQEEGRGGRSKQEEARTGRNKQEEGKSGRSKQEEAGAGEE